MSRQKLLAKAFIFICTLFAAYLAVSCFLGDSEAAGRKRHKAKSQAASLKSTIDYRQLTTGDECSISGFVLDYKEKTEVANAKLQARLLNGRQKLLTEYSEDDGFYCFSGLKTGKYSVTTKKSGYQNNVKKLEYKDAPLDMNIYLKCKSSDGCADTSGGTSGGGGGSSGGSTSGGSTSGGSTGSTDKTAPTTTATPPGGTYASAQTVTLTCADNVGGSGCSVIWYSTDGKANFAPYSSPITISSTTTLYFSSEDKAGNVTRVQMVTYTISSEGGATGSTDTTAPTTTANSSSTTGPVIPVTLSSGVAMISSTSQTVALTCADTGGSGCKTTYYTMNGSAVTTASSVYTDPVIVQSPKPQLDYHVILQFFSMDNAGNKEAIKYHDVYIDNTAPSSAAYPPGGTYTSSQSVALKCGADVGDVSGCKGTYYTTNGTTPTTASLVYSSPILISTTTTLKFFSVDGAGNQESVKTATYTINAGDATAPTNASIIHMSGHTYATATTTNFDIYAKDNVGVTGYYVSESSATPSSSASGWTSVASAANFGAWISYTFSSAVNGLKTVYAWFKDAAGNVSSMASGSVTLDTVAPVTTASPAGGTYTSAQTVTLACSDSGSGCLNNHTFYTTDGTTPSFTSTPYSAPISISATTTLKFFSYDVAGTPETVKTETYTISSPPVTYSTGLLTVRSTWLADLDSGVETSSGADIWFEAATSTQWYITPYGGATLGIFGTTAPSRDQCVALAKSTARIPFSSVPVGTYVCYQTGAGRPGEFRMNTAPTSPLPTSMTIGYATWTQ